MFGIGLGDDSEAREFGVGRGNSQLTTGKGDPIRDEAGDQVG